MCPENQGKPRVGIPWRTSREEADKKRHKITDYEDAIRRAGGESVLLSLQDPAQLQRELPSLDAFVLPGSPDDVDPSRYGAVNQGKSNPPDADREATDVAILNHALAKKKPVLAICYGCQLLNVHLGGTLVQDIWSGHKTDLRHRRADPPATDTDPIHAATIEPGSRLATLAGAAQAEINSSHHQAIHAPGRNLRVTGRAADGIIEGVEWTGDTNWVIGVQWHPERMRGDRLSERLFEDFVAAARGAPVHKA